MGIRIRVTVSQCPQCGHQIRSDRFGGECSICHTRKLVEAKACHACGGMLKMAEVEAGVCPNCQAFVVADPSLGRKTLPADVQICGSCNVPFPTRYPRCAFCGARSGPFWTRKTLLIGLPWLGFVVLLPTWPVVGLSLFFVALLTTWIGVDQIQSAKRIYRKLERRPAQPKSPGTKGTPARQESRSPR